MTFRPGISITLVFFGFWGCNDPDFSTNGGPSADSVTVAHIESTAKEMALYYSSEYLPPAELTSSIERDLWRIHRKFGISPNFRPPWSWHGVALYFDSLTERQILAGENEQWNKLLRKYDFEVSTFRPLNTTFFYLDPGAYVHPERLAEKVEDEHLCGVIDLWPGGAYYPIPDNVARLTTNSSAKYFLMNVTCPDLWSAYRYFEVKGLQVIDHGYFNECAPDSMEIWVLPYAEVQRILDSIEASRPAWVDTARDVLGRLEGLMTYEFGHR